VPQKTSTFQNLISKAGLQDKFVPAPHHTNPGVFLESLDDLPDPLPSVYVEHLDSLYAFSKSKNAEIISRFYIIAMKGRWERVYLDVAEFLGNVGRMKYVRPGYRGLNEVDRELAVRTFREHEGFYHPICRAMVKKDLKLE
jgi:leukotriene-A4 hydrolase